MAGDCRCDAGFVSFHSPLLKRAPLNAYLYPYPKKQAHVSKLRNTSHSPRPCLADRADPNRPGLRRNRSDRWPFHLESAVGLAAIHKQFAPGGHHLTFQIGERVVTGKQITSLGRLGTEASRFRPPLQTSDACAARGVASAACQVQFNRSCIRLLIKRLTGVRVKPRPSGRGRTARGRRRRPVVGYLRRRTYGRALPEVTPVETV